MILCSYIYILVHNTPNIYVLAHDTPNITRLFESKKKVMTIGAPDAQIVFLKTPFIQYEQILLTKSFRQYLETIMLP